MNKNLNVGIIGAGIQGISNALFLQKKGFKVTIFLRENPGRPVASYGNAGHFSPYASLSLNRTDILMDVPKDKLDKFIINFKNSMRLMDVDKISIPIGVKNIYKFIVFSITADC